MNRLFVIKKFGVKAAVLTLALIQLNACATMGRVLNPFYEPPSPVALLGDKNDHALNDDKHKAETARIALEAMSTYQRANSPEPQNPVMRPAVVRLMWIPDHLNKNGDLVPAHFYYLKVKDEQWAVQDAFELEGQLKGPSNVGDVPFMVSDSGR